MRRTLGWAILPLALLSCASCIVAPYSEAPVARPPVPPPPPPMSYDASFFYDALDPYGDWLWLSPYGWVWTPTGVGPGFRPYADGRWIFTDDGWMWVAEEPWGWGPYHYGRWFYDARFGWCWLPGMEWAPAWVAWRWGDGWLGWAPLPPGATVRAGVGLDLGPIDLDVVIQPFMWQFIPERYAFEPRLGVRLVPVARNVTIVRVTRTVTDYVLVRNRVVNRGVDVDVLVRAGGRRPERYRVVEAEAPGRVAVRREGEVQVWRPVLRPAPRDIQPDRGRIIEEKARPPAARAGAPSNRAPSEAAPPRTQQIARGKSHRQPVPSPPMAAALEARRAEAEADRLALDEQLKAQKEALRKEHEREARRKAARAEGESLRRRQEEEERAFDEEAKRQRELLRRRQEEGIDPKPNDPEPPAKKTSRKASSTRPPEERP